MNPSLKSRFCTNLGSIVIWIVLSASILGCNRPTVSSGTQPPQVSIQNATATRDPATGLPIVTVDYTVKYPSDMYAQTLPSTPTLTCSMKQTQLTRDRTFTGAPVNITGMTIAPQTGQATISVSEDDKAIGGEFSIECSLNSDRQLAISNTVSVNIPQPTLEEPGATQTQSTACQWQVAGPWNITQANNYHPVFEIAQTGTTLTGTATLSEGEASAGGYTGTTGTGVGSVNGDVFTFTVTWPPKTDGQVISGTYTGTITEGRIDGQDNAWYGTGSSTCANP
ncbi:MAG: hypothetical protein M3Y68_09055 [Chloroflexota bacterium]|nr:hypothetical protein [Chloroflexota bacterium]